MCEMCNRCDGTGTVYPIPSGCIIDVAENTEMLTGLPCPDCGDNAESAGAPNSWRCTKSGCPTYEFNSPTPFCPSCGNVSKPK